MKYIELFNCNKSILVQLNKCVHAFRKQNYDRGIRQFRDLLEQIQRQIQMVLSCESELQEAGIQIDSQYVVQLLSDLLQAQEQQDYILLPDLLELTIEPFATELQVRLQQYATARVAETENAQIQHSESVGQEDRISKLERGLWHEKIDLCKLPYLYSALYPNYLGQNLMVLRETQPKVAECLEKHMTKIRMLVDENVFAFTGEQGNIYFMEETQSGFFTLRVQDKDEKTYYLHSNKNVLAEADVFAETYINVDAMNYHILGAGLGYHWMALGERGLCAKKVHVYETDKTVLVLNLMVHDLRNALRSWLVLHEDTSLVSLSQAIAKEPEGFLIHHPSLRKLEQADLRRSFEKFFITENSWRNHEEQLIINFQLNHRKLEEGKVMEASAMLERMAGKKVVIIAAGPSLDKNIHLLKEQGEAKDRFLLATGTVFYKLMQMGIRPDAVIVTDSNERVVYQIREQEKEEIPMFLLSTAFWGFAQHYQGPKYMLYQQDFERAEKIGKERGYHLYQTGGSVSTTALDLAITAKAGRIIFIGLDLAFTDNRAHATGTSNQLAADEEELIPIKACNGGTVLADQKFIIYREWMERRLQEADARKIPVINATEGGCYLKGAEHQKLSEVL